MTILSIIDNDIFTTSLFIEIRLKASSVGSICIFIPFPYSGSDSKVLGTSKTLVAG